MSRFDRVAPPRRPLVAAPRAGRGPGRGAPRSSRSSRRDASLARRSTSPAARPAGRSPAAYEADRLALRGLRDRAPEPPRDLWARTAAAIERESASHRARRVGRRIAACDGRCPRSARCRASRSSPSSSVPASCPAGSSVDPRPPTSRTPTTPPVALASSPPSAAGPTPIAVGAGAGRLGRDRGTAPCLQRRRRRRGLPVRATRPTAHPSRTGIRSGSRSPPPEVDLAVAGQGPGGRGRHGREGRGRRARHRPADDRAQPGTDPADHPVDPPSRRRRRRRRHRRPRPRPSRRARTPRRRPPSRRRRRRRRPPRQPPPQRRRPPGHGPADSIGQPSPAARDARADRRRDPGDRHGRHVVGESAAYSPDGAWFAFTRPAGRWLARPGHLRLARRRPARPSRHERPRRASSRRGPATALARAAVRRARRCRGRAPRAGVVPSSTRPRGEETAIAGHGVAPVVDPTRAIGPSPGTGSVGARRRTA